LKKNPKPFFQKRKEKKLASILTNREEGENFEPHYSTAS
jgi:hypothetical protein